jgi:hypothetical protein
LLRASAFSPACRQKEGEQKKQGKEVGDLVVVLLLVVLCGRIAAASQGIAVEHNAKNDLLLHRCDGCLDRPVCMDTRCPDHGLKLHGEACIGTGAQRTWTGTA